jgi:alkylation response protein AidB-like acyl-CoA dehydrogenase
MATTPDTAAPALPIVPSDEERMLRETVRQICAGFGPDYTRRKVAEDEPPRELWDALASRGFLGVNLPEEYGGGGLGMRSRRSARRSPPAVAPCC